MKIKATSVSGKLEVKDPDSGAVLDGVTAIQITTESDGKPYLWVGFDSFAADLTLGQAAAPTPPAPAPAPGT